MKEQSTCPAGLPHICNDQCLRTPETWKTPVVIHWCNGCLKTHKGEEMKRAKVELEMIDLGVRI